MAEVYRARDPLRGRIVALKLAPRHARARSENERALDREAHALRHLPHPYFCQLFETGRLEGRRYLILELVSGETLAQRLRKSLLSIPQALHIGAEIASALAVAHRKGFVHGDLKPANIMLTRRGVKLLDFGLAEAAIPRPIAGHPRRVIGTCQYVAPELVRGKPGSPASDVFALGVILFEMLTARRPFEGGSEAGVMLAVLHHAPPCPSSLRPGIPSPADRLVKSCLAKNPRGRLSATRLSASLARIAARL